tara:strand:- start:1291 stop:1557 length:267 start_codon:yes stop_codon:yes gene_type:complete
MAQSLPEVDLPVGEWVDLYAETGIAVGTKIIIQNTGSSDVFLSESSSVPSSQVGFNILIPRDFFTNDDGNIGAWAISELGTNLQVEEA